MAHQANTRTRSISGQVFHYGQKLAVNGHTDELPGYVVKWGKQLFTFFAEREAMVDWFNRAREECQSSDPQKPFKPLEVVHEGQRCGFFADIECYVPLEMPACELDALKADTIRAVNEAYAARGLDSEALLYSENHRDNKISFHVVGQDVDFEGTDKKSDLCHVAKKVNRDCLWMKTKYPNVGFVESGRTGRKENLLDLAVYSKNRAMRCIFSSKERWEDSWLKPCAGFEGRGLDEWWIVRDKGSTREVHIEPWDDIDEQALADTRSKKMDFKTYNPKAFKRRMQSPMVPTEATDAQESLVQRLEAYFQDQQDDPTISVRFYGPYQRGRMQPADSYRLDGKGRHCITCSGGAHTSNGAGKFRVVVFTLRYRTKTRVVDL